MKVKFRKKSNRRIYTFDDKKDKDQIKSLRMSKEFQELMNLGG